MEFFRIFFGIFLRIIFWEDFFWEKFFGRNFLGGILTLSKSAKLFEYGRS